MAARTPTLAEPTNKRDRTRLKALPARAQARARRRANELHDTGAGSPARCWNTALTEANAPEPSATTRRTEHPAMAALLELLNTAADNHTRHLEHTQLDVSTDTLANIDPATLERIAYVLEHFDATPIGQAEAADRLGFPRNTIDTWGKRGVLPPETWTVGGRRAWATSVIDIWALLTNRAANLDPQ